MAGRAEGTIDDNAQVKPRTLTLANLLALPIKLHTLHYLPGAPAVSRPPYDADYAAFAIYAKSILPHPIDPPSAFRDRLSQTNQHNTTCSAWIGHTPSVASADPTIQGILKGVNSKALTAREREVWFKLVRNFTPTRSLQFHQKHDDSPACLVCGAPKDDREHYFFDCVDSRNVWIAARGVLCDALGLDTIDNTHYTAVQRMFGLPKLKASLRDQEGAGRTIEILTGLVLEMISSGRWGMQKWGTRLEGVGGGGSSWRRG
ncbi:BZ3500_MvSof-1268-A1-R1_Chr5-2g08138 [Microbotryum saponariae]|uniref:BZ3500_MvSof-1268-A1-R1_Chr5-2g08138 protein n=1 Tax=Microbotryum saponariae TaxID=289078 RepID=A0A2X0MF06_9BASI|nr:BZ3500_MvSof-1268-A1-R1_Chr5-2g08138 [Microbotryum saponariae]